MKILKLIFFYFLFMFFTSCNNDASNPYMETENYTYNRFNVSIKNIDYIFDDDKNSFAEIVLNKKNNESSFFHIYYKLNEKTYVKNLTLISSDLGLDDYDEYSISLYNMENNKFYFYKDISNEIFYKSLNYENSKIFKINEYTDAIHIYVSNNKSKSGSRKLKIFDFSITK